MTMKKEVPPNPDRRVGGTIAYQEEAEQARREPNTWFVFRTWPKGYSKKDDATARASAANIRYGKYASFRPAGAFDAVSRRLKSGEMKVYMRYKGEPEDTE